ncbi:bluetail domain-containing putative surface protein [uncultured Desulfovibrio sp.]|uniref:bluetail domain-containing putative surface protein n=1 Tax=uncultured Desulfovibrio sp. TaxID=167968 RepID=UPI00266F2412|nr:bluetail domain-containing putative surface protein [uncultured Desulfovibrio sp.]
MATPKWFDANAYMQNKLAQLKAQEPDAGWTLDKVYDTFRDADFVGTEGQYEHFVQYGAAEEVAPNAYFDADEYYAAKAKQYYEEELKQEFTGSEEQIAYVKSLIKDAGMNAWTHYQQFGSAEGVNPSNAFDASDYCAAKAEAMNNAGQKAPDGTDWTAESIAKAIDDAGMSVLEHYLTYAGTGEGEVAAGSTYPVSGDEQVSKPGETFYLTADRDSLVGTSGDDVFRATTAGDMNDFDTVDGGAGNDTLEVYTDDALKGTFTNIENLVVAGTTAAASYDLSSFSKSFTLKADADTEVTDVTGQKLVLDGVGAKALTVKMAADQASVELVSQNRSGDNTFTLESGAALKSVNLTLDEAASSVKFGGARAASIETLAVKAVESSTADVATVDLGNLSGLKDITVTGDASVTLNAVDTATELEILNASNATGGVTVDSKLANTAAFTGGAGNDTITLGASTQAHDMGAGDDTVKITEALGKGVSINGGDGIDTLEMTTNIAKDFRVGDAITGFETLKLTTGTDTVDMDNFGDINHVIAGSQAATIKNIDSNGTIEFNDNGAAMTVTVKDADIADNTSDVLNVTIADDGDVIVQKLTVANVENINITADDTDLVTGGTAATLTLAADKATSVTVSGDAKLTLNLDAVSTAIKDINASENTGGLTVDLSSTPKGVTVTGSSAADEITLGAQTVATGGEGKDTFTVTATEMTKYATITDFGAGDTITMGSAANKLGEAISLQDTAQFADYVNEAVKGNSTNNVSWFTFGENTYLVLDAHADATFNATSDMVVQLQGVFNLEGMTFDGDSMTLPEGA